MSPWVVALISVVVTGANLALALTAIFISRRSATAFVKATAMNNSATQMLQEAGELFQQVTELRSHNRKLVTAVAELSDAGTMAEVDSIMEKIRKLMKQDPHQVDPKALS